MKRSIYESEEQIVEVVEKFESCHYALAEFSHSRHLTVAAWYLETCDASCALERMREGLRRFLAHHKKTGYHETITRFWMELLRQSLGQMPAVPRYRRVNEVVSRLADKNLLFEYYTRDLVLSDAARETWVEPNLRQFAVTA
jgi:hypothetical protein